MEVKRYDQDDRDADGNNLPYLMFTSEIGDFVKHSDYAALLLRCEAAETLARIGRCPDAQMFPAGYQQWHGAKSAWLAAGGVE